MWCDTTQTWHKYTSNTLHKVIHLYPYFVGCLVVYYPVRAREEVTCIVIYLFWELISFPGIQRHIHVYFRDDEIIFLMTHYLRAVPWSSHLAWVNILIYIRYEVHVPIQTLKMIQCMQHMLPTEKEVLLVLQRGSIIYNRIIFCL